MNVFSDGVKFVSRRGYEIAEWLGWQKESLSPEAGLASVVRDLTPGGSVKDIVVTPNAPKALVHIRKQSRPTASFFCAASWRSILPQANSLKAMRPVKPSESCRI